MDSRAKSLFYRLVRSLVALPHTTRPLRRTGPVAHPTLNEADEQAGAEQGAHADTSPLRHLTELQALAEVSRAFRRITDRHTLFAELTARVAALLDAEPCAFVLRDPRSGDFVLQWPAYGLTREQVARGCFPAAQVMALLERIPEDGVLAVQHPLQEKDLMPGLTRLWGERSLRG